MKTRANLWYFITFIYSFFINLILENKCSYVSIVALAQGGCYKVYIIIKYCYKILQYTYLLQRHVSWICSNKSGNCSTNIVQGTGKGFLTEGSGQHRQDGVVMAQDGLSSCRNKGFTYTENLDKKINRGQSPDESLNNCDK